jgi:hypothetical protein
VGLFFDFHPWLFMHHSSRPRQCRCVGCTEQIAKPNMSRSIRQCSAESPNPLSSNRLALRNTHLLPNTLVRHLKHRSESESEHESSELRTGWCWLQRPKPSGM